MDKSPYKQVTSFEGAPRPRVSSKTMNKRPKTIFNSEEIIMNGMNRVKSSGNIQPHLGNSNSSSLVMNENVEVKE